MFPANRSIASCILAGLIVGAPSPSMAMTGAEWLAASRSFAEGFAWGSLNYRMVVAGAEDIDMAMDTMNCMRDGNIGSAMFADAVRRHIENDPATLTINAAAAVVRTAIAMCP